MHKEIKGALYGQLVSQVYVVQLIIAELHRGHVVFFFLLSR